MTNALINREMSDYLSDLFHYLPVITLTGPRQSGKTTICRTVFPELPYTNFEDLSTLAEAQSDPKAFLAKFPQGVIIDEAHNFPEIFSYLQVEVDKDRMEDRDRHFIVTGSSNFSLMQRITQSMAGRTAIVSLLPLSTREILANYKKVSSSELLLRGGYPAVWKSDIRGRQILLSNYYTTYIERDIRSLINIKDLQAFQTFIRLAAGRIGQEFNASSLSIEVGVSVPTIKNWLSVLKASYVVYLLHPYYANIGKRLTKTPKLYFYDTGLATFLLGINSIEQLDVHPLRGSLMENMVVNDIVKQGCNRGCEENIFFYRDKSQHEVDLLRMLSDGSLEAYEIKSGMTYNADYFRHLRYLKSLLGDRLKRTMLLYDGEEENFKDIDGYCNYRNLNLETL